MTRLLRRSAVALAAGLVLGACGSGGGDAKVTGAALGPGEKPAASVTVKNLKYAPKDVAVQVGDAVTWTFADGGIPHDVKGKGFASPKLTKGTWTHRFEAAGTFSYSCTIHPFMKGTVTVRK